MTNQDDWLDYLGERYDQAADDYEHAVAECTAAESTAAEMDTPLFHATVAAMSSGPLPPASDAADQEQAWVDQLLGNAPPAPDIDPDTHEGDAIMRLFRNIKNVEEDDELGSWPGGDVVEELLMWFRSVGIDPNEHTANARQRLALAVRKRPGQSMRSADYTARIGTENRDAEQILTTALAALADQLGPGTSVRLHDADDEIAHFERPATPR